jgi:isoquinoline 1-oxidoreductase alpha subunit
VLRDVLGMTSTKFGCGMALCGACTVHVDGGATRSCITIVDSIGGSEITTIEAIGATPVGAARTGPGLSRERYLSSRGGRLRVKLRRTSTAAALPVTLQ